MGIRVDALGSGWDADLFQQRNRALQRLIFAQFEVNTQRFADLFANGHSRVKAGHRVLEDHADLAAPDLAHLLLREIEQVLVVKQDAATCVLPGRLGKQTHDREGCDALTTAALTYYTYLLAWLDPKGHPVNSSHAASLDLEVRFQVLHL